MEYKVLIKSQKVKIGEHLIHFTESKLENARPEKTIVMLPGTLGSGWSDFQNQLEKLPKILPNYKIIAWDPPGLGKSIPPKREYTLDLNLNDAKYLKEFIDKLKIKKFSLLTFSGGAITAYYYLAFHPEDIEKAILISPGSGISEEYAIIIKSIRDVTQWPQKLREDLENEYGIEYLKHLWEGYVDILDDMRKKFTKDFVRPMYERIKADTLILYGESDYIISRENDIDYLNKSIKNTKVITFWNGKHNLQNQMPDEINETIKEFLMSGSKI